MRRFSWVPVWLALLAPALSDDQPSSGNPSGKQPCEICLTPATQNDSVPTPATPTAAASSRGNFVLIIRRERSGWVKY